MYVSPDQLSLIHMHIPYRFLLTVSDGGTIKIDLHSNATCSVSNIKSSPSHWDRQTVISSPAPSTFPPEPPPPFSSQGPRDSPFSPGQALSRSDRLWPELDWQPVDASLSTAHTHSPLLLLHTHTQSPFASTTTSPSSCIGLGVSDSLWASALQAAQNYTYKSECVSLVNGTILTLSL